MLSLKGYSAWISVDGRTLPSYLTAINEKTSEISCWIQGDPGKPFLVYWQDHSTKQDSAGFVYTDGVLAGGRFLYGDGIVWRRGVRTSETTERPFMFAKIEGEPKRVVNSKGKPVEIGTIIVKIKLVDRLYGRDANPITETTTPNLGKRQEGDVYIDLGKEIQTYKQYEHTWAVKAHGSTIKEGEPPLKPETYVKFVFRYRTRAFLEQQGIVPEIPPPRMPMPFVPGASSNKPSRRVVSAPTPSSSSGSSSTPTSSSASTPQSLASVPEYISNANALADLASSGSTTSLLYPSPRGPAGSQVDLRRAVSHSPKYTVPSTPDDTLTVASSLPSPESNFGDAYGYYYPPPPPPPSSS